MVVRPSSEKSLRRPSLLVVDDDDDGRMLMAELLDDAGYAVATAPHGRAALDQLLEGRPFDAIVLDLAMPVMDGWELLAELRARPSLAVIPVVVVSASHDVTLEKTGACAFLQKPLHVQQLLDALERCLLREGAVVA